MNLHLLNRFVIVSVISALIFLTGFNQKSWATNYVAIDLNPSGFTSSQANGIDDGQVVGWGYKGATNDPSTGLLWNNSGKDIIEFGVNSLIYAVKGGQQVGEEGWTTCCLWHGTPESKTVLNDEMGIAFDTDGVHQVGCSGVVRRHASLWSGTAESFVDLHPIGYSDSFANGVSGDYQVGYGYREEASRMKGHALLWNGSATKYLDLTPSGFPESFAVDISGSQQVGYGITLTGNSHALIWYGSAASVVDLNPNGFTSSSSFATNGTQQVGKGNGSITGGQTHGIVWNSTAEDYVDLHQFLSSGFVISYARGIDDKGNIVGNATDSLGNSHAILWQPVPVPEPAAFVMLGMAAISLCFVWRRKGK
jgi:hypothetical protein